ncbi:MAG TPA: cytochrome c biogenesis protein CcdA [Longimicrobiales bacterium]|nr:cytochrome c biogenesis protein CcdA [Longimicrobiales bacterium]
MEITVSFPLAFLAGVVSFLSPCVLPVVPSYVVFVSGVTLEELRAPTKRAARHAVVVHSLLFVLGFTAVFMTMGWAATSLGQALAHALPWMNRAGGVILILFGLHLAGVLRMQALAREVRLPMRARPAGPVASFLIGVAFGAGWTPCIGPVLASILLYASLEATQLQGTLLLATYALGLGLPFVLASVAFNGFLAGAKKVRDWLVPLSRVAGATLVLVGLMMVTGSFATLTAFLAGLGQFVNLEMP